MYLSYKTILDMKKVLNKRSNDTSGGYAKSPTTNNLEYGEIAVNYHDGVEKLFIKNDYNQIVSFPTDEQVTAGLNEKQDVINDLSTIRSGAALGATAVQTETDPTVPSWAKQSSKPSYSYDEITGTEEKKTNQEFVYRQSPTTIKAKTVSLDKIYGKTLAWNQRLSSITFDGGVVTKDSSVTSEDKYTVNTTQNTAARCIIVNGMDNVPVGHKALVRIVLKSNFTNIPFLRYQMADSSYDSLTFGSFTRDTWQVLTGILNNGIIASFGTGILPTINSYVQGEYISFPKNGGWNVYDLTLLYGSAISGMTNEQIIAKFNADYPALYDYSAGKLISNDAATVKTVGFNLLDEEWDLKNRSLDGTESANQNYLTNKTPIRAIPNTEYYFYVEHPIKSGRQVYYLEWDASLTLITRERVDSQLIDATNLKFAFKKTSSNNALYIGLFIYFETAWSSSDISATRCCINLSNPSKNGTYEPYRKSTMRLGLNNFKVKSHNIWDEEWEAGGIDDSTGLPDSVVTQCRSKNFIGVIPGSKVYFRKASASGNNLWAYAYDNDKNYIGRIIGDSSNPVINMERTIPSGCYYIKFKFTNPDNTITYNNDICINVSSSFNGQYDPYGDNGVLTMGGGVKVSRRS